MRYLFDMHLFGKDTSLKITSHARAWVWVVNWTSMFSFIRLVSNASDL